MSFEKTIAYLDSLKEQFNVRCTETILLRNHSVLFHHLNGTKDIAGKIPLTEEHLHNVFSASKVLTMTAVMQLVDQGKLGLEDELSQYLPEFSDMQVLKDFDLPEFVRSGKWLFGWPTAEECGVVPAKEKITIRRMMSMSAGFSYQLSSAPLLTLLAENPHAATREIVSTYAQLPLLYEPGTHYSYSMAHDILAAVVEVVSGMKFSEYMRKNIFDPLGVGEKDIYYQIPEREKHRISELYEINPETGEQKPVIENAARFNDTYESGGAGVGCTVKGYVQVIDALANGGTGATGAQILSPKAVLKMSENQLSETQLSDFHIGGKLEYGYGLGVRTLIDPTKSKSPLGEFGWDGAAGAYVLVDPKNHLALFYVQEAPDSGTAFSTIHPTLRDLIYEGL